MWQREPNRRPEHDPERTRQDGSELRTGEWTLKYLEGIREDRHTFQPFDGANHVLWTLGHLAETDRYVTHALRGTEQECKPGKYGDVFGMGSTPADDLGKYPSPAEVKGPMAWWREELLAALEGMSEADLLKPALSSRRIL